eukprot:5913333-Pyramimonas_sp.AAC.1
MLRPSPICSPRQDRASATATAPLGLTQTTSRKLTSSLALADSLGPMESGKHGNRQYLTTPSCTWNLRAPPEPTETTPYGP